MKKAKRTEENKVKYGTISLPINLIEKIKERIKGTGMSSVSSYVAFVLRHVLSTPEKFVDSEEEKEIKLKLKSLGY